MKKSSNEFSWKSNEVVFGETAGGIPLRVFVKISRGISRRILRGVSGGVSGRISKK